MVQLNPVPVFCAKKKYQYHLTAIFHRHFRTDGKHSLFEVQEDSSVNVAMLNIQYTGMVRFLLCAFINRVV